MNQKKDSNIPLWAIVLGFIFFWPAGVVLLFLNLGGVSLPFGQAKTAVKNAGAAAAAAAADKNREKKLKQAKRGTLLSVFGGLLAVSGLYAFIQEVLVFGLQYPRDWFTDIGIACGGLAMLGFGISRARFAKRWRTYQGILGNQRSISIRDLSQVSGISEKKVITDLEKLLEDGLLPMGYIDRSAGRLVLSSQGYQAPPEPERPASTGSESDDEILRQIRAVNDAIPDPAMSAKIDRIGEITGRILDYQRQNPSKASQLRPFLNYYLPTTLRLLKTYANLDAQGVNGENITAAKVRIEGMMDKVVEGFEKQLDQLFQTDAMDIAADVEVLERMLRKDGLGGQGLQL